MNNPPTALTRSPRPGPGARPDPARMNENAKVRLLLLIPALVAGVFIFQIGRDVWRHHWLVSDAAPTRALITNKHSRGVVDYQYTVDEREYAASIRTHWDVEKFARARIGEESVAFYSTSHPWLSSLETADFPKPGWATMAVALGLELFFVLVIFKPKPEPPATEQPRKAQETQKPGSGQI
jgi:hypothetical protein